MFLTRLQASLDYSILTIPDAFLTHLGPPTSIERSAGRANTKSHSTCFAIVINCTFDVPS